MLSATEYWQKGHGIPVHTSNNVATTLSNATRRTILSTVSIIASTLFRFWQQCRTKFRPFDNVETKWTCSICFFDFVEMTKFYDKLVRHCWFGNKVECCVDKVKRCFDIVAGVDGALRRLSDCSNIHLYRQKNNCFYGYYTGQPVLAGTPLNNLRILLAQSFTACSPCRR